MKALRDSLLIYRRSLTLTLRQPVWIIMGIFQPILYLVLFGPLLEASTKAAGAGTNAFNWFIPGLLVQIAVFGGAFVGFGLVAELRNGVVERMRVTPMSRSAMLVGRSLRDVTILVAQGALMIVLAIPFGLHLDPAGSIALLGLLALIGLVTAPLSYTAALVLKSEDALPMALAPDWLRFIASLNPLTHAVDASRALFNGDWGNVEVPIGIGLTTILAIGAVWLASRAFSRANA